MNTRLHTPTKAPYITLRDHEARTAQPHPAQPTGRVVVPAWRMEAKRREKQRERERERMAVHDWVAVSSGGVA